MKSLSEIETTSKRASRATGFSWGIAEEVGKNIRLLELFGLPGVKNLTQYYLDRKSKRYEDIIDPSRYPAKSLKKAIFKKVFPIFAQQ